MVSPHSPTAGVILISLAIAASGGLTLLAEECPDKDRYNLFNRVPDDCLRDFAPNRAGETEGTTTVDAGHYQLEMGFASFTRDQEKGVRADTWNVAPFNLRIGLLNNTELDLLFDSYLHSEVKAPRQTSTFSGVGDLTAGLKVNLWGNDGGSTRFAVFGLAKFPTNTGGLGNNAVEGGVIFPFSVDLPGDFEMGMETGVGLARNEAGRNYHAGFVNSIEFSRDITKKLGAYIEFFSSVSTERDSDWIGTFDFGLTYSLTDNMQIDCSCELGLTRAADDVTLVSGISIRF